MGDYSFIRNSSARRRWRLLQVESSLACNLSCVMCPWSETRHRLSHPQHMSQEVWAALLPYLPEIRSVDFTGGGEPLLQPRLAEWVSDAHQAGCETGVLTNGLLLDGKTSGALIEAGIDWICVSIDAATAALYEEIRPGSDFDRVSQNLRALAELRRSRLPKLMINFVLMSINVHHVGEIIRLAARLGVDQVNFKQCDVIRGEQGKGLGLFSPQATKEVRRLEKMVNSARKAAKKLNIKTTTFAFIPEELPVCSQDPRDALFIRHDGSVAPCINLAIGGPTTFLGREVIMPTVHYGRLPEDDLLDLWKSETCRFYRDRFHQRVERHTTVTMESLAKSSFSRQRILQTARDAMPEAPDGCKVCHYLYDI
jgi:MoaA/NifB/PqqE/SkfB family radical SAM enzyme